MTDQLIVRAQILLQQKKYDEASQLLGDILRQDPANIHVLAMLSEVKLHLDQRREAEDLINSAIGLAPDESVLYYIKARIVYQLERYDEAERLLQHAIVLDPQDAAYFSLLASIKLERKQFDEGLRLADKALELDPENVLALNARSTALLKLDRKDDAFRTIEGALAEDPNNAYTHSNYGWGLLEKGDHNKALSHFREALRNDPNFRYAQAGMMEALKARYWFYRVFLKYVFWISNLTAKYQWGVILGLYFGTRLLSSVAERNPTLQPFLTPVIVVLALIAFSTWVITPLSNLFLRLNPFGKHLLDQKEIQSSNFVGISLLLFVAGLAGYLFTGAAPWLALAGYGFAMMVPFSAMFTPAKYNSLTIYAGAMAVIGALAVLTSFATGELVNGFSSIFLIGFIAFQWIVNFVKIRRSNV